MHELGIMTGVMESVESVAREAGAERVLKVSLQVGVMTEAIEDALQFAFEALAENNDYFEGATLEVEMTNRRVSVRSVVTNSRTIAFTCSARNAAAPSCSCSKARSCRFPPSKLTCPMKKTILQACSGKRGQRSRQAVDSEHEKE